MSNSPDSSSSEIESSTVRYTSKMDSSGTLCLVRNDVATEMLILFLSIVQKR